MNFKFDFVGKRKLFFILSASILLLGIASLLIQGLNLGVDFVSGSRVDVSIGQEFDLEEGRAILEKLGYENPSIRKAGNENELLVFRTDENLEVEKVNEIRDQFREKFGEQVAVNEQTVDPIVGRELAKNAMISVLIASVGIILYVTIRFEYRFAMTAVLALFHDALFVIGIFSIFQWEVDLVFVAAVLTIVGYSVNDTIVVFDRIRENIEIEQPKRWEDLKEAVNRSLQQTLVRSINTGLTVIFAAAALFAFGGESIRYFSLALLLGLFAGIYSSVFVASQVWITWKWKSMEREKLKAKAVTE
ncbi:preprotein translocase subunit SecF [Desmospora profundinema]|uniref:Protein-export membrane protein SecF n=1 Tax=Desmospora profundinema TaxID=1571184 RepID=A0ABU1INJ3_9BACL|nr:protein translocase subunit SecF [Desmospora profundinema]MDR6226351.1 preprotein translocase subunit SecF [Desmospora profundinema]